MNTLIIQLPQLIEAQDYHSFSEWANVLRKFTGKRVHFVELSHGKDKPYAAVFYVGNAADRKAAIEWGKGQITKGNV